MKNVRKMTAIEEMPDSYLTEGHFWIQEYVVGLPLRFEMEPSGLLRFGDREVVFENGEVPLPYRPAITDLRADLDRDRLRAGTEQVDAYTFSGIVPLNRGYEYDWGTIPTFLGTDIWDGTSAEFAAEDVVERVFDSLGLDVAPILRKEVPARQFSTSSFDFPRSRYADSTVPAVILRKKHGTPALFANPDADSRYVGDTADRGPPSESGLPADSVEEWLREVLTTASLSNLAKARGMTVDGADPETLATSIGAELARREYHVVGEIASKRSDRYLTAVRERVTRVRTQDRY